jgi:hypothetical protein
VVTRQRARRSTNYTLALPCTTHKHHPLGVGQIPWPLRKTCVLSDRPHARDVVR